MKAVRQKRIAQLIRSRSVTSQEQLVKMLHSEGLDATQATVSRDLEELGAVKVRMGGKIVYSLDPDAIPAQPDSLKRTLNAYVDQIESSANLVVLKTPPGHAGVVASALDRAMIEGIAGTVAGDDTILVVCSQGVLGRRVEKKLRGMIESLPVGNRNGAGR